jgi:hypothetical protein
MVQLLRETTFPTVVYPFRRPLVGLCNLVVSYYRVSETSAANKGSSFVIACSGWPLVSGQVIKQRGIIIFFFQQRQLLLCLQLTTADGTVQTAKT